MLDPPASDPYKIPVADLGSGPALDSRDLKLELLPRQIRQLYLKRPSLRFVVGRTATPWAIGNTSSTMSL